MNKEIQHAASIMQNGGVIAYPTEAVFGLGCDPSNENAVMHLLKLKQRSPEQGLILIAANIEQLQPWIADVSEEQFAQAKQTWPGPFTWVFPAKSCVPHWIKGKHSTIAVRVTAHPIARGLCIQFNGAIVSTSANTHGSAPAKTVEEVKLIFDEQIDCIVSGDLGELKNPTEIRDVISGKIIRKC